MKFCASQRIKESTVRELDQKIQMEAYLREKKDAILKDRKVEYEITVGNGATVEEDRKSCL